VAEVTGLTAARMQEIVDASVVSGSVDGSGHLILHTHDGGTVDAGDVIGPQGDPGPTGPVSPAPTGSVIMFGSVTPPSGWVVCNGAAISRTTQAALFAVIGTSFGVGDGSTTFNVPNMTGRFPRHQSPPGGTGGADNHPHTHSMAQHKHQLSGGSPEGVAHITMNPSVMYMEKVTGAVGWSPDTQSGQASAGSSGTLNAGAKLAGNSAVEGATVTGSDNTNTDPPYVNFVFIIKL